MTKMTILPSCLFGCGKPGGRRAFTLLSLVLPALSMAPEGFPAMQEHFSEVLGGTVTLQVLRPETDAGEEPMPVLFILGGNPGNVVRPIARRFGMIVVRPLIPDNPAESAESRGARWERYFLEDLLPWAETNLTDAGNGVGARAVLAAGEAVAPLLESVASGGISVASLSLLAPSGPSAANPPAAFGARFRRREGEEGRGPRLLIDADPPPPAETGLQAWGTELRAELRRAGIPHIWREGIRRDAARSLPMRIEAHFNFHQAVMLESTPGLPRWTRFTFSRIRDFLEENAKLPLEPPAQPTVCLLGSSSMQKFPSSLLPGYRVFNRGIAADHLGIGDRGISHRLDCSAFDMRPDFLFIKNGRNDLAAGRRSGIPTIPRMLEEYERILDDIRRALPRTRIFVVTCAPVRDRYAYLADRTAQYNRGLIDLARRKGFGLVDLHAALLGEDGLLQERYSKDGLHMSAAAEKVWAAMMIDAMEKAARAETPGARGETSPGDASAGPGVADPVRAPGGAKGVVEP